jgi:hypothetical protein
MNKDTINFYHGGVTLDFTKDDIDVFRLATKQGKHNRNYAGFYMFGEELKNKAYHYAEQTNLANNTTDKGVIKIELDPNLNIKTFDRLFEIDRLTQEQLLNYQNEGYDLIKGKSIEGYQYVLLNKDKIENVSFEPINREQEHQRELQAMLEDEQELVNSISKSR